MPQEAFYATLIDNMYDGVYFVDKDRVITYWNKSCERITGYKREEVIGRSCRDNVLNHCTEAGGELCLTGCPLSATISDGSPREADVFLRHADGHRVPVRVRVSPIQDENGQIIGAVETFSNNSDLLDSRHQLRHLEQAAIHDPLTGAGNRLFGETRLRSSFLEFHAAGRPFGLLFVDLDDFKVINDTHGHNMGDRVLQMTADTMRTNLRESDSIIRWGGEEFLVLLDTVDPKALTRIAEKLRHLIGLSRLVEHGQTISVTASIGATLVLPDDTPESIVTRADQFMYASKTSGKNRVTAG